MRLDLAQLKERYLVAQLEGNRREAMRLILDEGLERGASALQLAMEVIQEAQREIGRLWQEDQLNIAQEHMATAISQAVLAHLYQRAIPEPALHKKILVACVEGEQHDFPARLVADVLDLAGFNVRFLGANVPTESLLKILAAERPDLLALSVTMTFNLPALRAAVAAVREQTRGALPIAIGGHACSWSEGLANELRPDATGKDAHALVGSIRDVLFPEGSA